MLSRNVLLILDAIAKAARGNDLPMGGLQTIFCGDFFQLPPVSSKSKTSSSQVDLLQEGCMGLEGDGQFAFDSDIWNDLFAPSPTIGAGGRGRGGAVFCLEQVYRQQDSEFVSVLQAVRTGNIDDVCLELLNSRVRARLDLSNGVLPTQIFTHKCDVDGVNQVELEKLKGSKMRFQATDSCQLKGLLSQCPAKETIYLMEGAQVMLVKTIDAEKGLVNGARGVIKSFEGSGTETGSGSGVQNNKYPFVQFENGIQKIIRKELFQLEVGGKIMAQRSQIPLDLGYAISCHKAQGLSVDKAVVDLNRAFEHGQAYCALSRTRSLAGLSLVTPLTKESIKVNESVKTFYETLLSI